jgi:hypothetical protein
MYPGMGRTHYMALHPGDILVGKFEIIREVGEGGFGKTFLGRDIGMERPVAIKELLADRETLTPEEYEDYERRFVKEAQITSKFAHPNVVVAYALETDLEGNLYLVLEFVDGQSLEELLAEHKTLPTQQVISVGIDICSAISAIYARDIVHRDIKPSNVLLTKEGQAKLTDFGVAQLGHETRRTQEARGHPGTPAYKSPEQAMGMGYLDERSDVYSLGMVLYEMLTGRLYLRNHVPPRDLNVDVPVALDTVVMRALQEDPNDRYQTAEEMRGDLLRLQSGNTLAMLQVWAGRLQLTNTTRALGMALLAVGAVGIVLMLWQLSQVSRAGAPLRAQSGPTPENIEITTTATPIPATPTFVPTATPEPPTGTPGPTRTPISADVFEPDEGQPLDIAVGEVVQRNFAPEGDRDYVTFQAKEGRMYAASTSNLAIGVDTQLVVVAGGQQWENDDVAPGRYDSRVEFQAPADSVVMVTILNKGQYGKDEVYDISVFEVPPTPTPTLTGTAVPTVTSTQTPTPTHTPTLTPTPTPTRTSTPRPTNTPTQTPTPSRTLTPIPPDPEVDSIRPSSASNDQGSVSVTIVGENFRGAPQVSLIGEGPDIPCTGVNVTAGSRINCSFDISGAKPGTWDVLVINPDGTDGKRSNAFKITAPTSTPEPTDTPEPTATPTEVPQVSSVRLSVQPPIAPVGQSVTIYAVVRDQFGDLMRGQAVQFSVVSGQGTANPSTADTNAQGQAQTDLTSTTAGSVRVRGTADGISDSIEVQFTQ